MTAVRVATLNVASGRDRDGRHLDGDALAGALAALDVDVLALQELDVDQPRSMGVHQGRVAAAALRAAHWRFAPTLTGTPGQTWEPVAPRACGTDDPGADGPRYGVGLVSRAPVRTWSVLGLGNGKGRLPLRVTHPRTGRTGVLWFPDEPRVALAAELDDVPLVVVSTHLSFAPLTAWRQLRRLRAWATRLAGPDRAVLLAGDLNLPGRLPGRLAGGRGLVTTPTFPAERPGVQLDHLLALGPRAASLRSTRLLLPELAVGDHRPLGVAVTAGSPATAADDRAAGPARTSP